MVHRILFLFLFLSVLGCSGNPSPVPSIPQPGAGESAVIAAGPDEYGSYYLWRSGKGGFLLALDDYTCRPGDATQCRRIPAHCEAEITVTVCGFSSDMTMVQCEGIDARAGDPIEIRSKGAYTGVRMDPGVCLDGIRKPERIAPGSQYWLFPDGHVEDMHDSGPEGPVYVHPIGGPVR